MNDHRLPHVTKRGPGRYHSPDKTKPVFYGLGVICKPERVPLYLRAAERKRQGITVVGKRERRRREIERRELKRLAGRLVPPDTSLHDAIKIPWLRETMARPASSYRGARRNTAMNRKPAGNTTPAERAAMRAAR